MPLKPFTFKGMHIDVQDVADTPAGPSLLNLPDDVMEAISAYLLPEDLAKLASVSKEGQVRAEVAAPCETDSWLLCRRCATWIMFGMEY